MRNDKGYGIAQIVVMFAVCAFIVFGILSYLRPAWAIPAPNPTLTPAAVQSGGAGVGPPPASAALAMTGDVNIANGFTLSYSTATPAPMAGQATFSSGKVTVSTTAVTASDLIIVTPVASTFSQVIYVPDQHAGVDFDIYGDLGSDSTTKVNWMIVHTR